MRPISIKDLRNNLSQVASKVQNGESFVVLRRSTPCCKIIPYSTEEIENDNDNWDTVIDFTEGGSKDGIPAKEFFDLVEKVHNEEKNG